MKRSLSSFQTPHYSSSQSCSVLIAGTWPEQPSPSFYPCTLHRTPLHPSKTEKIYSWSENLLHLERELVLWLVLTPGNRLEVTGGSYRYIRWWVVWWRVRGWLQGKAYQLQILCHWSFRCGELLISRLFASPCSISNRSQSALLAGVSTKHQPIPPSNLLFYCQLSVCIVFAPNKSNIRSYYAQLYFNVCISILLFMNQTFMKDNILSNVS